MVETISLGLYNAETADDILKEVSNVGEICRAIFSLKKLENKKEDYKQLLLKNRKKDI